MHPYAAEFIGTAILILMGNGVVANVLLSKTKGHGAGWVAISAGWGFAVYTAVLCVGEISGAHINPAVTIALAAVGKFAWSDVPGFVLAQVTGAMLGAAIVYIYYKCHFDETADADLKLATFCTAPNIRALPHNFFSELVGTFVLVYAVLLMSDPTFTLDNSVTADEVKIGLGSIGALRVGLIVFAIGLSLGGT
ncbi:MAG: aquaporin family protein, partial [Alkalinema sp. RL_2_19]|nr:aquaporin family protein [Alkalinema sp. RL_2_19]